MKNFFDHSVQAGLLNRLKALEPGSPARWGRMDSAQMLAHCTGAMRMTTGELPVKSGLPALFGWIFKRIAYNDTPFRTGAPTAAEFRIVDPKDFQVEKARFLTQFAVFTAGPSAVKNLKHPFFGMLTPDQYGMLIYKHLDHHFRQFGV
jgi:hypothetical protein